ncbi:MAG: hypothetical protein OEY41_00425 [Acidimicrobiia bacterium]|nr:hypothetical protein [Acidimicrobiia bacterium]MDH5288443.1 hypothetical protein [Acidimicrobiia bacterium]
MIDPVPSDEEAAAVAAALMLVLSGGADGDEPASADPRWRFSGRWWNRPLPMGRARP